MDKNTKEFYLNNNFCTTDPDEARDFAHRVVFVHKINFNIYNNENSDVLTIEFDEKKRGILWPATLAITGMWVITQFDLWTLGEIIR